VQRAVAGERAAMEQIMRSLERPFFNLAFRMLLSPAEAEDATQELILETAKHFIQEDEPERIDSEIRTFLASTHAVR
jgi:DNA-directed RNA polymerase specialized sigma24 family protein